MTTAKANPFSIYDPELSDEFNLRSILAHITVIRQRLDLLKLEGKKVDKEIAAAKTGLTVTQSAIEELLK